MLQFANDVQYAVVEQLKLKWEGWGGGVQPTIKPQLSGTCSSVVVYMYSRSFRIIEGT